MAGAFFSNVRYYVLFFSIPLGLLLVFYILYSTFRILYCIFYALGSIFHILLFSLFRLHIPVSISIVPYTSISISMYISMHTSISIIV